MKLVLIMSVLTKIICATLDHIYKSMPDKTRSTENGNSVYFFLCGSSGMSNKLANRKNTLKQYRRSPLCDTPLGIPRSREV